MQDLYGMVHALTMYDGWLIAGGWFPRSEGNICNGIARWVP